MSEDPKDLNEAKNSPEWPEGRKPVTNKWVFVRKYKIPGMDFNDTYSPVVRLEAIRAITERNPQRGNIYGPTTGIYG
jgi:hypothetical protein